MLDRDLEVVLRLLELPDQRVVRGQIERAGRAIDDRGLALSGLCQQSGRTGHGRNLEGPREDHAVGGAATVLRDDRRDLVHLELREDRGQQLVDHHDRAALHRLELVAQTEQPLHHAIANVGDVRPALAEIRVLDLLEGPPVGVEDLGERRPGRPGRIDRLGNVRDEALILEDLDLRVEHGRELRAELVLHDVAHVLDLAEGHVLRPLEALVLLTPLVAGRIVEARELDVAVHLEDGTNGHTPGGGEPADHHVLLGARLADARLATPRPDALGGGDLFHYRAPLVRRRRHQSEELGVDHDRCEKRRTGLQQLDVRLVEATGLHRLDHDHADHDALHDQGRRQQRREALLPGLREVAVVRMALGVLDRDRLAALRRHADEPFSERHLDVADRAGLESHRRRQGEDVHLGVDRVDRANVRIEPLRHEVRDVGEGLLEVVGSGHDLRDIREDGYAIGDDGLLGRRAPGAGGRPRG